MYGKLESNFHLSNKKALFVNMQYYYNAIGQSPFDALPITYHVKKIDDVQFVKFKENYAKEKEYQNPNIWIIKPGEDTNRGCGIEVSNSFEEIA
jgi:tubulin--tyrosine ligase